MIAPATTSLRKPLRKTVTPRWHRQYLEMLPTIRNYARGAFGHLNPELSEELIQETIANTAVAFVRMFQQGKADRAFPTVLAHYAIAQIRDGRQISAHLRIGEVLSLYAQRKKGFVVDRLDRRKVGTNKWREAVVEDRRTSVPDQAAFKIDFPIWLKRLGRQKRRIAEALAMGNSPSCVADRFKLSRCKVSLLRGEFYRSWQEYHGEPIAAY